MSSEWLIDNKIELRPREDGSFDELLVYDKPDGECIVHAEMMSNKTLWIGFYPPGEPERRVVMWISSNGKLRIWADEDGTPPDPSLIDGGRLDDKH